MMLGRRPRLDWIEIDGSAHIMRSDKYTYCRLPLNAATVVMVGQREGCLNCISSFAAEHTEPELVVPPMDDAEWEIDRE